MAQDSNCNCRSCNVYVGLYDNKEKFSAIRISVYRLLNCIPYNKCSENLFIYHNCNKLLV